MITEKEVNAAQQIWCDGLLRIGEMSGAITGQKAQHS